MNTFRVGDRVELVDGGSPYLPPVGTRGRVIDVRLPFFCDIAWEGANMSNYAIGGWATSRFKKLEEPMKHVEIVVNGVTATMTPEAAEQLARELEKKVAVARDPRVPLSSLKPGEFFKSYEQAMDALMLLATNENCRYASDKEVRMCTGKGGYPMTCGRGTTLVYRCKDFSGEVL